MVLFSGLFSSAAYVETRHGLRGIAQYFTILTLLCPTFRLHVSSGLWSQGEADGY
jgi:hypothetical protein